MSDDENGADALSRELDALARSAHPALRAGCRRIAPGDELALTPAELRPMERAIDTVRRASGAARIVARALLTDLGAEPPVEIVRSASRAPIWPPGFIGSLTHDREYAAAAVARAGPLRGVGIDIEPRAPVSQGVLERIATDKERAEIKDDPTLGKLLFCIKEAVYKATNPVDGVFLEHHDVEVSLRSSLARTRSGRTLQFYTITNPRLIALALVTAPQARTPAG